VSAKAFIFLFIYTHLNQSQFGQLGGRKSDWLMMDGWMDGLIIGTEGVYDPPQRPSQLQ